MSKALFGFIGGLAAGAALTMAYLHRDVITAAIKGEELPEAPEGCPFAAKEDTAVETVCEEVTEAAENAAEAVEETAETVVEKAEEAVEDAKEAVEEAAEAE